MFYGYSAYSALSITVKIIFVIIVAFGLDIVTRRAIVSLFDKSLKVKIWTGIIHWAVFAIVLISGILGLTFFNFKCINPSVAFFYYLIFTLFVTFYLPKIIFTIFIIAERIIRRLSWKKDRIKKGFLYTGIVVSLLLTLFLLQGVLFQRYMLKVNIQEVNFKDLPKSFDGYRIVQFSDVHCGSLYNKKFLEKVVRNINRQQADMVVFTGDFINLHADEAEAIYPIISKIKAKDGKYAVLGNHDMGDYLRCSTAAERQAIIASLTSGLESSGYLVMSNCHHIVKKETDSLALIGVLNWGRPPYRQYGDLDKAMAGVGNIPFKILLSHDPEHWEDKVVGKTDIQLTLCGHTHGGQIGFIFHKIKACIVMFKYRHWTGLNEENGQWVNISNGVGTVGFLGRAGIRPEINVIAMRRK